MAAGGVLLCLGAAGCGGTGAQSVLGTAGSSAGRVEQLWWPLLVAAVLAVLVVTGAALLAVSGRRRRTRTGARPGGRAAVLVAGVVVPSIVLTGAYVAGLRDMRAVAAPEGPADLTIEVTAHRWWWEARYPDSGVVTANEIHLPVGQDVRVLLTSDDVNHSFWVPRLAPKQDVVAGRVNDVWLDVEEPGRYRGQCAEFCGLQHGLMGLQLVAQAPEDFETWLDQQRMPAPEPGSPLQAQGLRVLTEASCASCHAVRGTEADGVLGPDLTHLYSRESLAAGAVPNTPGHLAGWISNSQTVKPGNLMPPQPLSPQDLLAVTAYLARSDEVGPEASTGRDEGEPDEGEPDEGGPDEGGLP